MFLLGIVAFTSVANAKPDTALKDKEQCSLEKMRAAAAYLSCRLQTENKAFKKDQLSVQSKCDKKISEAFDRAEMKYGSACSTTGDVANFIQQYTPMTDRIHLQLSGIRYIDNGDGTVSDTQTGLMWEKKDDSGGIHDKDNLYSLSATDSAPDGTAYTVFLGTLNKSTSADGKTMTTNCFAAHCDWRLPTISELQSILLESSERIPYINPIFGPTISSQFYWTGTSDASSPYWAWEVLFYPPGYSEHDLKTHSLPVRAVRSGP